MYFVFIVVTQTDFVSIVRGFTEGPREAGGMTAGTGECERALF